jgi:hypothetical protein
MDVLANHNQLGSAALLEFESKPDGRLEARYQAGGLMEGLLVPRFVQDHFRLQDFTPFHDEVRKLTGSLLIGKYVVELPPGAAQLLGEGSLGLFQAESGGRFGFYYLLSRTGKQALPTSTLLRPFLDVHLPGGVGMTFDEEMVGSYFEGASGPPPESGGANASFRVRMVVRDLNEFIEGREHEAVLKGTISFDRLDGRGSLTCPIDERTSRFNYLRVNEATREAEMRYHIDFRTDDGTPYTLEGRKYLQKDQKGGIAELLEDYTTLYSRVFRGEQEIGTARLKFRTFEDLAAIGNLAGFLASFQVTGTDDPLIQLQGRLRFLAFTGQFVQREYDPLSDAVKVAGGGL